MLDAMDDRRVALEPDIRTHSLQFQYMHEAVLEDILGDCPDTVGDAVQGRELGLHVGREPGIRHRADFDGARPRGHVQFDPVGPRFDPGRSVTQL